LLQAVFIPILLFFIPIHDVALGILLAVMTISSMVNHLNIEIYPHKFEEHWLGKWLIGATHHSLHHTQFKYNFGLYFTFWDKLMKTESPQYVSTFKDKTQPTPHEVANKT
jgi:sterol desaturase/sphingolipid hydroxylase (fatty acid hydroxylase superfamily)